jgi:hypothetical protein
VCHLEPSHGKFGHTGRVLILLPEALHPIRFSNSCSHQFQGKWNSDWGVVVGSCAKGGRWFECIGSLREMSPEVLVTIDIVVVGEVLRTIRIMKWYEVEVIIVQESRNIAISRLVPFDKLVRKVLDHHRRNPLLPC